MRYLHFRLCSVCRRRLRGNDACTVRSMRRGSSEHSGIAPCVLAHGGSVMAKAGAAWFSLCPPACISTDSPRAAAQALDYALGGTSPINPFW